MEEQKTQDYGYEKDAQVTISGALFDKLCMLIHIVGEESGVQVGYHQKPTIEEQLSPDTKPEYFLTKLGMLALTTSLELEGVHKEHIEKGIAKPIEELEENKPKISLAE